MFKFLKKKKDDSLTTSQKIIKETKSIILIVVVVFAFRSVFFEPFKIPSGSMIPTLMIGDFILVNKMSYGFKVPFSDMFADPIYISEPKQPKRGDVIVFKYPDDVSLNFIKRVIGLPGDIIEMRDKVVFVNGTPLDSKLMDGTEIMKDMDERFKFYNFKFYENKTGEHDHITQTHTDSAMNSDFGPYKVPDDNYFVMGDNRDFSSDSRSWGPVPYKYIKGRAILVWFSMIFPFDDEVFKFRPSRIGTLIH